MNAAVPSPAQRLIWGGIAVLTLATALIHLSLNFPDPAFILNGLGYLALLAALLLPLPWLQSRRALARWALLGFTALTIALWLAFGAATPIGYVDKAVEVALLALLLLDMRWAGEQ